MKPHRPRARGRARESDPPECPDPPPESAARHRSFAPTARSACRARTARQRRDSPSRRGRRELPESESRCPLRSSSSTSVAPDRCAKREQMVHAVVARERSQISRKEPFGHASARVAHASFEQRLEQRRRAEHAAGHLERKARRAALHDVRCPAPEARRMPERSRARASEPGPRRVAASRRATSPPRSTPTTTARASRSAVIAASRYSACAAIPRSASGVRSDSP